MAGVEASLIIRDSDVGIRAKEQDSRVGEDEYAESGTHQTVAGKN
jgi:hypothetical protein